jgi:hypothetical protein
MFIVMGFANKQEWLRSIVVLGVIASAIGISTLAGYPPIPCGTIKQYAGNFGGSYDTRSSLIVGALETFSEASSAKTLPWLHMLLGDGFGASARASTAKLGEMFTDAGSHNLLIDLLVDTGGLGLVLFLLALGILIIKFVRPLLRQDFPDRRLVLVAMAGILMVDLTMLMLTTTTYREYLGAFLIGVLMGSAVYMVQRYPSSPSASNTTSDTTSKP